MAKVRPVVNVVRLRGCSIFRMLQLEEALLRTDDRNWLLLNEGTDQPAIVMGISGKPPTLLNIPLVRKVGIPVIKRFTGGGTVVVDGDTLFATLLMRQDDMPDVRPYPRDIMSFMEAFYQQVFAKPGAEAFRLKENDFVFGNRKFGGNAQSITKLRWLHHTSFLWDYQDHHMDLLKHPDRAPDYRKGRAHGDFLCRLRERFETKGEFSEQVKRYAEGFFKLADVSLEEASKALSRKHYKSTRLLLHDELDSGEPPNRTSDTIDIGSATSVIRTYVFLLVALVSIQSSFRCIYATYRTMVEDCTRT